MAPTVPSNSKIKENINNNKKLIRFKSSSSTQMNRLHHHHHHQHHHNGNSRNNNNSGKNKFRKLPSNSNLDNYEHTLISYLNKLKNIFSNALFHQEDDDYDHHHNKDHPEKGIRENTVSKFNKLHRDDENNGEKKSQITMDVDVIHPAKYSSSNPPRPREQEDEAFNIVSAAIAYGIANNILEKIGNYFVLKNNNNNNNREIAPRIGSYSQPTTPAPRYCRRCCNIHKCIKNPTSETVSNNNCGRRSAPVNLTNNSRNSSCYPSNNKIFHCPDCRELERVEITS